MSAGTGEGEAETAPRHTIGELLRETRQSYGGDIDRIAATLRIRPSYLRAIEDSQYNRLPGLVYAQGFVRAYAVHLGLDGDEAIRRFKQEGEGFEVTRDLSFPVALAARSIPGGTMVLAALILAVCGYGLWYYVSTGDRTHPERVSAVPSDLLAATEPAPPSSPAAPPRSTESAASSPPTSAAVTATLPPPPASPPAATPPLPAPPAGLSPPATPAAASGATSAPPVTSPTPAPVTIASAPAASAPAPAPILTPPPPQMAATAPPAAIAPPAATPSPPADAAVTAAGQPRVYGAPANVPARIVVHAIKDSWVQLRDGDDILVQRLLHPGDTVRVPDEPGLVMRTGNGAGIELEVDGKLGKPLSGTVRTLDLNPNQMIGGTVSRGG